MADAATTRNAILDAADGLFAAVGFDAATTREIGELSGANKALIHYHFGGKEGLLDRVLDRYYERLTATVAAALSGAGTTDTRLDQLIDAYVDFLDANRNFFRIVQREAAGGPRLQRIVDRTAPILRLGVPLIAAELPNGADDRLATQLAVSFYGMIITWFAYAPPLAALTGADPLASPALAARKAHLRWMLKITLGALRAHPEELAS